MSNISYNVNGCIIEQVYPPVFYLSKGTEPMNEPQFQKKIIQTNLDKYIIHQKLGDLLTKEIDDCNHLMCFFFSNDFTQGKQLQLPSRRNILKGQSIRSSSANDDDPLNNETKKGQKEQSRVNQSQQNSNDFLKALFNKLYLETRKEEGMDQLPLQNISPQFTISTSITELTSAYHITSTGRGECPLITYAKSSIESMKDDIEQECDTIRKANELSSHGVSSSQSMGGSSRSINASNKLSNTLDDGKELNLFGTSKLSNALDNDQQLVSLHTSNTLQKLEERIQSIASLGNFKDYSLYIAFFSEKA